MRVLLPAQPLTATCTCTNHAPPAPPAPLALLALCFCYGSPLLFCSVLFCFVLFCYVLSVVSCEVRLQFVYIYSYICLHIHVESQSPTTTQLPNQLDAPPVTATATAASRRTPTKRTRRPHRHLATAGNPAAAAVLPPRTFAIGELIWGPARGHPAWPGKIVKMPDGVCTPSQQFDHVWVQWFGGGGRSTSELIPVNSLQSLSEGLEVHHKAQKDTRK